MLRAALGYPISGKNRKLVGKHGNYIKFCIAINMPIHALLRDILHLYKRI